MHDRDLPSRYGAQVDGMALVAEQGAGCRRELWGVPHDPQEGAGIEQNIH